MNKKLNDRVYNGFWVLTKVVADINGLDPKGGSVLTRMIDSYDEAACEGTLTGDQVQEIIIAFTNYGFDERLPRDFQTLCLLRNYLYALDDED